ncbi:ricin-type beta-trefoil lectin domain protein [Streptomyces antarcticus]|uniref:ricin-type beta-trefoil lectin domain protein n=1 Tax=Streptomyces antarcticus TaxID=2996458 RepID=UPI002270BBC9|nr:MULTISPECIES: ricin-type beta-trefoil lectin domain protein [unclassified Streptomyces]MCY0940947.1 ricin-type beta-trefoil lectin domain protein [Streptomyces sp. H34-AA3]MCZ4081286.1 ricin-type beta-trefoil lectin domain protein [Streptomyces sp. H34-S5]
MGPPAFADDARGHGPADSAWPAPPPAPLPGPEVKAVDAAKAKAKSAGKPVVIEQLTTASSQTFANPSGSLTTDSTPVPQRVKTAGGTWKPLDATLVVNADGTVEPTASTSQLSFSGGGLGPMATMTTADGGKLALKAPFPLPKPVLSGDSALYRAVLPDVDLELTATPVGGWRQILIVRSNEAAANPAVRELRLGVEADGLTLSADSAGNLNAADSRGKTRFSAPTPLMWDSSGTASAPSQQTRALAKQSVPADGEEPARSSTDGPGRGAVVKRIGTTVDAQGIQLVPDATLLGQGTGPWYIDPGINPTIDNTNQAWAQVQEAYPGTNEFNGTQYGQDKPATGYCGYNIGNPPCDGIGRTRAYFQIGVDSRLHNAEVINASFYATVISSSSPSTPTPMGLYSTGAIGSPTSWDQQPCGKSSRMAGCSKIGHTNISGTGDIAFDVKELVRNAVRNQWPTITVGLAPDDESNKYYRQRFNNTPHIVVEYDITPTVWWPRAGPTPGFAGTGSYTDCRTPGTANPWDNPGWIGANNNITLSTNTYSATGRQLWTAFQYWDDDDGGKVAYAESGWNGSSGTVTVDVGQLTDGHQYGWMARNTDGTLTSANTEMCFFRVDRTPPTAAVTSTDFPASDTIGARPKLVGQEGTFTLTGADTAPPGGGRTSGLACARWTTSPVEAAATGWKCTDTTPGITKLTGNQATVKITPRSWGTNYVYLQTQDNAGNMSQPVVYSYYAPSNPAAGKPVFGDVNGDHKADMLLPDTAGNLRKISGGSDPYGAPAARMEAAAGNSNDWNGIQTTHRGTLGRNPVADDLIAHQPDSPNLYLYPNANTASSTGKWFDGQAPSALAKPSGCVSPTFAPIDCAAHQYGTANWSGASQIAAFGSYTGDSGPEPSFLPRTSLLFVENGRLWLSGPGTTNQLAAKTILLSGTGTAWDGYELITPGRAQGTDFPTLFARDKTDGTVRAFAVKGTAQAPDLTGFTDPSAGPVIGTIDPKIYPRAGSDGDLDGDGLPDLWALDTRQQLVAFSGIGTPPGGGALHPTVTNIAATPVTLGNLNTPKANWLLAGQSGGKTPDRVGVSGTAPLGSAPGTVTGVTFPEDVISGRTTGYAAFTKGSAITAPGPVIDTRKSFTISTMAKVTRAGGVVLSQDLNRNSSLLLFPNHQKSSWQFALANGDAGAWPYDETTEVNTTARLALGVWTQLTAVFDHTTGLMRLYVNGTLSATGHHDPAAGPAPSGPFTLGRFKSDGAHSDSAFEGGISNVAVYPYAASVTASGTTGPINLTVAAAHCIDNDGGKPSDGNKIQIAGCNGTPAQQFEVRNDGSIRVQGKCLNAAGSGTSRTTPIELRTCTSVPSQMFLPRADGALFNPVSGLCLDLGSVNTQPGTPIQLWDCNPSNAQRWTIPILGTARLPLPQP